jgi:hypothetical protein
MKPYEKHGMTNSIIYRSWAQMLARTTYKNSSKNHPGYTKIHVCKRWRNSFLAFLSDMGERPSLEHSLDRRDNKKGYYPGNCRWATATEQLRNRSEYNVSVTYRGKLNGFQEKIYLLCELAELSGIHQKLIRTRLQQGMNVEDTLQPINLKTGLPLKKYSS